MNYRAHFFSAQLLRVHLGPTGLDFVLGVRRDHYDHDDLVP